MYSVANLSKRIDFYCNFLGIVENESHQVFMIQERCRNALAFPHKYPLS